VPTAVTKFEVHLPTDSAAQAAVDTFLDTIGAIVPFQQQQIDVYTGSVTPPVQQSAVYGLLTSAQVTAAQTALTTLNTALVAAGDSAVLCFTETVTTQP
jgi:hypothetical protein